MRVSRILAGAVLTTTAVMIPAATASAATLTLTPSAVTAGAHVSFTTSCADGGTITSDALDTPVTFTGSGADGPGFDVAADASPGAHSVLVTCARAAAAAPAAPLDGGSATLTVRRSGGQSQQDNIGRDDKRDDDNGRGDHGRSDHGRGDHHGRGGSFDPCDDDSGWGGHHGRGDNDWKKDDHGSRGDNDWKKGENGSGRSDKDDESEDLDKRQDTSQSEDLGTSDGFGTADDGKNTDDSWDGGQNGGGWKHDKGDDDGGWKHDNGGWDDDHGRGSDDCDSWDQSDSRPAGSPHTGVGGSVGGLNTTETAIGTGLLAAVAGGGIYMVRRRRMNGGQA